MVSQKMDLWNSRTKTTKNVSLHAEKNDFHHLRLRHWSSVSSALTNVAS